MVLSNMWTKVIVLILGSAGLLWVSRRPLQHARSHGYYRFFAWEAILILVVSNLGVWFKDPWRPAQIVSWILLCASLVLVLAGYQALRRRGKPGVERQEPALIGVERTTELVTDSIYRYIRHPMYASLMALAWGVFFKQLGWLGLCLAGVATFFLWQTARIEEGENLRTFGPAYQEYLQHTRRFIPFLW
jgi:protein-S-isoprenylcysteine O-methyltransferase Ste14